MLSDNEIMAQVMAAFQGEQSEHRQAIGDILLELEATPQHPHRAKVLEQLFREAHSLKGAARAAGLIAIEQVAHRLEDVMSAVREDKLQLTPDTCDPLYAALDAIGEMAGVAAGGQIPDVDAYQPLLSSLDQVLHTIDPGKPRTAKLAQPQAPAAPVPAPAAPTNKAEPAPAPEAPKAPPAAPTTQAAPAAPARVPSVAAKLAGWNNRLAGKQPAGGEGVAPAAQNEKRPASGGARAQAPASGGGDDTLWKADATTVRLSTTALDSTLR